MNIYADLSRQGTSEPTCAVDACLFQQAPCRHVNDVSFFFVTLVFEQHSNFWWCFLQPIFIHPLSLRSLPPTTRHPARDIGQQILFKHKDPMPAGYLGVPVADMLGKRDVIVGGAETVPFIDIGASPTLNFYLVVSVARFTRSKPRSCRAPCTSCTDIRTLITLFVPAVAMGR